MFVLLNLFPEFSYYLYFYLIFIIFFPLPFSPLLVSPPAITTLLSMSMSPFSFLFNPSTPLPPSSPTDWRPALHLWVCPYFLCSVCSLDSTYEWSHRVFVFLWLAFSLSIMFSRSIHMLQRVKFYSFLQPSSIPLCKCPTVVLSTHLLMDTWAASISWQL